VYGRQAAYGGPFGQIAELQPGATLTLTTGQGTATYRVLGRRSAGDPQPPALASGEGRLTLVTASGTPYLPTSVLRVDAQLVSTSVDGQTQDPQAFAAPARVVSSAGLLDSERAMAIDPSRLFALVLWSQAFLIAVLLYTWARERWGRWQSWAVGVPVLLGIGWVLAGQVALLLPNLL
jgi:sortase A